MSILIRPVITEKLSKLQEENKFTFEVTKSATKPEIKAAVEAHGITVTTVTALTTKGLYLLFLYYINN